MNPTPYKFRQLLLNPKLKIYLNPKPFITNQDICSRPITPKLFVANPKAQKDALMPLMSPVY